MILLTAFAPFGPKGFLTRTNASKVVLDRVVAQCPGRFHTGVLSAHEEGLEAYRRLLQGGAWTGLLPTGETGDISSKHVVLERFANVVNSPGWLRTTIGTGTEKSLFAAEATAPKRGSERSAGAFWCNRIYLEALRWAHDNGNRPVAFVHVPAVLGESLPLYSDHVRELYDRYAQELLAVLEQMERRPRTSA